MRKLQLYWCLLFFTTVHLVCCLLFRFSISDRGFIDRHQLLRNSKPNLKVHCFSVYDWYLFGDVLFISYFIKFLFIHKVDVFLQMQCFYMLLVFSQINKKILVTKQLLLSINLSSSMLNSSEWIINCSPITKVTVLTYSVPRLLRTGHEQIT